MAKKIEDIEGIGPAHGAKLRKAGINSPGKLLTVGATAKGRKDLAAETGLSSKIILRCVNMADLFRIKGVASQYAELLEAAGVDTVKELRTRNVGNLVEKMRATNMQKRVCRVCPSEKSVKAWVAQAKTLAPVVSY